ncbi:MAG: helix-turn-helix transcriptional regulator [Chitinophagaceae bacterium]|nr:helix-turn-helix transcriptional regulator [Chitinophagaceae bacterium]
MSESDVLNFYLSIGTIIKSERRKANYKQEDFASLLNLSRSSVVNIEMGRQRPSVHLLWEISKILNIQFQSLIPTIEIAEAPNSKWKEMISSKTNDKSSKEKILGFIEQIHVKKQTS